MTFFIFLIILFIIIKLPQHAEMTMDGTLGQRGALPGPDYLLGAELG